MNASKTLRAASLAGLFLAGGVSAAAAQEFTKYVAIGDSITAGFQGACLVARHQNASYPAIVARQLGIDDFEQPLFAEGPLSANPAVNKCLGFVFTGTSVGVGAVSDMLGPTNLALPRPYDNLGIPGANVRDLINLRQADPNGNTANRFGAAILRNSSPQSPLFGTNVLEQALALQPDLVTVWIGNNDVLGAVLSGVALEGVTLTPTASFEADFTTVLQALQATGRTIVVLNVPDVDAVPFANTIPPFVVDPSGTPVVVGGQTIPLLGPGNAANPCPGGAPVCPVPAGTRVTLQAQPLLAQGFGIPCAVAQLPHCNEPLPDGRFNPPATLVPGVLLFPDEIAAIKARIAEYNAIIGAAEGSGAAELVDVHGIFDRIVAEGYHVGGITLTPALGTGGLFSADGFHPSNIAHGIIADEIIKRLNLGLDEPTLTEPNLSEVLFTPDVPPGPVVVSGVDPSAIAFRQLSGVFGPVAEGIGILEPRILLPPPRRDLPASVVPRVVERPAADRRR